MRRIAFGVSALFFALSALFIVGETLDDPGGLAGIGLIAAWAVPLAATMLVAWRRPDLAAWLLAAVMVGVIGLSAWFAADPSRARSIENDVGPVRAIVVFALAAALGVYGLKRTRLAGMMLLTTAVVPLVVSGAGHRGLSSLAAASAIPLITGTLYLVASIVEGHHASGRPTRLRTFGPGLRLHH